MTLRAALAPLVSGATYRRLVHLLLGGVILLPYVLLGAAFARLLTADSPLPAALLLLTVATGIVAVPAFLGGTRSLEIAAARALLDVDLPEPPPGRPGVRMETRLRGALWFAVHLLAGGLVGAALLIALPMALVFIAQLFGLTTGGALAGLRIGPLDEHDAGWLTVIGVLMLVGLAYAVAGLGALAALMAPVLLGPSPAERIAALEAEAAALAERNRLARELHDSVGHALTVATLQAAAARELLDRDPAFARTALAAIERTSRAAMADLDHVLGVLRDAERAGTGVRAPQPTLIGLDRLVADARRAGVPVEVRVDGALDGVPAAVSREGYRIVQEGLTNAARHARGERVTLHLAVADGRLAIDLSNPVPAASGENRGGGRGLAGMRERVHLLGGELAVGAREGRWRVSARLPTAAPADPGRLPR
ncbi:histidine kinase [Rhizomonospora bruguierae]|uniref:histidine kinase n=1 Tax=Rhizomonospora bruguierae TaxID=1581705 RepID=UPI001BD0305E|nr:histidine kinase [Micromonospora sp. NBRC 107566]